MLCRGITLLFLAVLGTPSLLCAADQSGKIEFNRDIRPILSDNCFYCHGPDKNHRDGKFRLDERESAVEKKAITPGKPEESELIARIFTKDAADLMPPPKSHKSLSDAQKQLLKRWIEQGAVYQAHWAYITPVRSPVPAVKDAAQVHNPIDAFVVAALEAKGLAPSPEADRRTLLRRLSLDLIGLPPTPAELQIFLDDKNPDAYERQVDRLLGSPRYGERMAVPWLDVVRFADTVGFHGDQNQNVFPYRDYVINAFNSNKPFDQFAIEQLAGDLLPNPTVEQRVATGFNRLNMMTREGGAQAAEYLAKYRADRVRTVGTAFLGSTFGCAECHDHKFDPITASDFYSLGAYFADIKQWGVYTDYSYTPNPDLIGWSNSHPFPPEITVDSPFLKNRLAVQKAKLAKTLSDEASVIRADTKQLAAFDVWRQRAAASIAANPAGWVVAQPVATQSGKASAEGDTVLLKGKAAEDELKFTLSPGEIVALRLEALPHASHEGRIARAASRGTPSPEAYLSAKLVGSDGKEKPLAIDRADADLKDDRYDNGHLVIGVASGWTTAIANLTSPQSAAYVLASPVQAKGGDTLVVTLKGSTFGCVRVSVSSIAPPLPPTPGFFASLGEKLSQDIDPSVVRTYLESTGADPQAMKAIAAIQKEIDLCYDGKSPTLVTQAWEPRVTRILPRGNWQDETGPVVEPSPPRFLTHRPASSEVRQTRLDLARWIVSPENPLTARTVVNRFWKQFFGSGISNTVDDLGAQGEWPSHPELLDWLAVDFRESGWDVKRLVRLIVTSATYRQDSNLQPGLRESDPANRLLASQFPRRLEAEFVRDNALFAAGLLNLAEVGGPSSHPYQPAGYYENIQFPSRDYPAEADDRQYRRGVYSHWQRTFLHPMLANFDAPSREDCTAARNVSNTPQQALTLLNDPTFVEAARVFAAKVIHEQSSDDARLSAIFESALSREPSVEERDGLMRYLEGQRKLFASAPADAWKLLAVGNSPRASDIPDAELAAWTSVCRVVLNLHESITRY